MKRFILVVLMIFSSLAIADSEEKGDFTVRPYKCIFIPSLEFRNAVYVAEGTNVVVRWGSELEVAKVRVENACAAIADHYGKDSSECYNHDVESLRCRRKWRGYYEF